MIPYAPRIPGFVPHFDVKESEAGYVFKADLPGVKEQDLDISLTGNRLTVSGKRDAEERHESETYFAFERTYGSFTRSFTLPEGADAEHVQAELKSGVLTLVLPKKPENQPRKINLRPSTTEKGKA
jgi:HSP20 family protein